MIIIISQQQFIFLWLWSNYGVIYDETYGVINLLGNYEKIQSLNGAILRH